MKLTFKVSDLNSGVINVIKDFMAKKHRVKKHHFKRHVKHAKRHAKVFKPKSVKHIETPAPRLPLIEKMPDERAFDLLKNIRFLLLNKFSSKETVICNLFLRKLAFLV